MLSRYNFSAELKVVGWVKFYPEIFSFAARAARHYTDYSPEKLGEVYVAAGLGLFIEKMKFVFEDRRTSV